MERALGWALFAAIVLWRVVELLLARRNTRALLAAGGSIAPHDVTGLLVVLHTGMLVGIAVERWLGAAIGGPASLAAGVVLALATAGRLWTLGTLGRRWTIRVVTVPGERAVVRGPYRFVRHPNYAVVLAEVLSIPVLFHAWWTLAIGTIPHVLAIRSRIRCENAAWQVSGLLSGPRP
jgi:methyltransferase